MKPIIKLGIVLGGCLLSFNAVAVQIMEWDHRPLDIELPVEAERLVILDRNVQVGLPRPIADPETLRVQSTGGVLYLKANEAFDTQRVQLKDAESGELLLVDLTANEDASREDIKVVDAESSDDAETSGSPKDGSNEGDADEPEVRSPVPVTLIRHAAQSLYAPLRTVEAIPGVKRVPMRLPDNLPGLMPALPVEATPKAAWGVDGWTVTAVQLTNQDPSREFELDPRWLQGRFYSASFMHPTLGRKGSETAATTVFLVTRQGGLRDALARQGR